MTVTKLRGFYVAPYNLLVPRTLDLIKVGATNTMAPPRIVVPCSYGMHASEWILDALRYRQTGWVTLVDLEEGLHSHRHSLSNEIDKFAGVHRTTLAIAYSDPIKMRFLVAATHLAWSWGRERAPRRLVSYYDEVAENLVQGTSIKDFSWESMFPTASRTLSLVAFLAREVIRWKSRALSPLDLYAYTKNAAACHEDPSTAFSVLNEVANRIAMEELGLPMEEAPGYAYGGVEIVFDPITNRAVP